MQSIFITGASGCVGHYVLERLARSTDPTDPSQPAYHLYVLVRDPRKLRWPIPATAAITILEGDLLQIDDHADLLSQMQGVIHLAAAWGDAAMAEAINVRQTLRLFQRLDPSVCQKILYFSTASLLNPYNQPLAIAGRSGTAYIQSKYEMLMRRSEVALVDRMITLYPTLLFGGSALHPYSHITAGLKDVIRWLDLLRFLQLSASFHFIHAEDIANMVAYLLEQPIAQSDLVLGNPPLTLNQSIEQVCAFFKKRIYFRIPLPIDWLTSIAWLLRVELSEWDRYCIQHRHFVYQTVDANSFGLSSRFQSLHQILDAYL
ncbi:MAG: NAD(P)-dependent oxidoreductase [Cyanobacteriota bacterium]|nr:NAD(P)-dependent oxidoreductase [Cyanobacteriota bacterium]